MRWPLNNLIRPTNFTWNRWFAWFPITVGDRGVWLEFVERKAQTMMKYNDPHFTYRLIGENR